MWRFLHRSSRWPARRQRSWQGRTGCATWRRRPATPSTWSTPSRSSPETSSLWCGPAKSPSRRAGRAWRAGSSPTWCTPQRKWPRATAAVSADMGRAWTVGLVGRNPGRTRRGAADGLRCRPSFWSLFRPDTKESVWGISLQKACWGWRTPWTWADRWRLQPISLPMCLFRGDEWSDTLIHLGGLP